MPAQAATETLGPPRHLRNLFKENRMITTRSLCVLAASSLVATMVACTASPDAELFCG